MCTRMCGLYYSIQRIRIAYPRVNPSTPPARREDNPSRGNGAQAAAISGQEDSGSDPETAQTQEPEGKVGREGQQQ